MDEKKNVSLAVVIINCICAVLWNVNVIVDLASGNTHKLSFILHIVCAVLWDVCSVLWIRRYVKAKKENT